MFGRRYIPTSSHPTPRWMRDLVRFWLPGYGVRWFPTTRAQRYGCHYGSPYYILELHCDCEENDVTLHLVLHEIAHGLCPYKAENPYRRGKPTAHHTKFWKTAADLFMQYGVYDYAMNGGESYAGGRRYLREHWDEVKSRWEVAS